MPQGVWLTKYFIEPLRSYVQSLEAHICRREKPFHYLICDLYFQKTMFSDDVYIYAHIMEAVPIDAGQFFRLCFSLYLTNHSIISSREIPFREHRTVRVLTVRKLTLPMLVYILKTINIGVFGGVFFNLWIRQHRVKNFCAVRICLKQTLWKLGPIVNRVAPFHRIFRKVMGM